MIERLFTFVVTTADSMAAMAAHGVDFVDEDQARGILASLLKHVTDPGSAHTHEHFDEVGAADVEEGDIGFTCNGACEQCLAGSGRTDHQDSLGNAASEFLKFLWVSQELHKFLHLVLGLFHSGDILEGDFVFFPGQHLGLALPEVHGSLARHLYLGAEEEVEHHQKQDDREHIQDGRGNHV